uniref:AP2/ERF domain-containing protein n=1 Tax=Macrostomum lignano TaxID=282301 RepID=A0A1I8FGR3_9PLAT
CKRRGGGGVVARGAKRAVRWRGLGDSVKWELVGIRMGRRNYEKKSKIATIATTRRRRTEAANFANKAEASAATTDLECTGASTSFRISTLLAPTKLPTTTTERSGSVGRRRRRRKRSSVQVKERTFRWSALHAFRQDTGVILACHGLAYTSSRRRCCPMQTVRICHRIPSTIWSITSVNHGNLRSRSIATNAPIVASTGACSIRT